MFWSRQGVARASSEKESAGKRKHEPLTLVAVQSKGEENYGDGAERRKSPDSTSLDFYLYGSLKNSVYGTKPPTLDAVRNTIVTVCVSIPGKPYLLFFDLQERLLKAAYGNQLAHRCGVTVSMSDRKTSGPGFKSWLEQVIWLRFFPEDFPQPIEAKLRAAAPPNLDSVNKWSFVVDGSVMHRGLSTGLLLGSNIILQKTLHHTSYSAPNASHMIQPLDKSFFVPFKSASSTECDKFMVRNPGRVITHREVSSLFYRAYERVATLEKAKNSFRATGIFPFNPEIFTEDDFLSSDVTSRPEPTQETEERKPQQKIQLNPDVKKSQQVRQDTFQTNSISRPDGENNLNGQVCSPSALLRLPSANLQSKRKRMEKKLEIMTSSQYKNAL
ncbi:hypothetical protein ANN_22588 [Periplaneta americana]|uniref:Uncharacterized protein n=1 Tax=Periplaneta americana TaxID=6978 RepID=A0ABQ8S9I0_PERAM|nr:hypothetical protein ANN_22588 [Periplaneta americana]